MAIDKITTPAIADDAVTNAKVSYNKNTFRNIVINGDMSQSQRATSKTSITSSAYYTIDRFQTGASSAGTWTQSQSTDVPTGQGFATSLKMDCTTANTSLGSSARLQISQKIEGQNLQFLKKGTSDAVSTTVSFWVKSNKTGIYIVELYDSDNTRHIAKSYTINVANTWEKKTLTYAGDTTGAFGNDNGDSLALYFWLVAGSTFNASGNLATSWAAVANSARASDQVNLADSTSNEWYITGVQLEAGTSASDFEFLPVDVNLGRCQRYFQIFPLDGDADYHICNMANWNGTTFYGKFDFIVSFRSAPSWTRNGGGYRLYAANQNALYNSGGLEKTDMTSTGMSISPASTVGSAGSAGFFWSESSAKNEFDAEL